MQIINPQPGDDIYSTLFEAVKLAPCKFTFNDWTFHTRKGESLADACARFKVENGSDAFWKKLAELDRRWRCDLSDSTRST